MEQNIATARPPEPIYLITYLLAAITGLLFLFQAEAYGRPLAINQISDSIALNNYTSYHQDSTGKLTIDEILDGNQDLIFKPFGEAPILFDFTDATYWLKINLINTSAQSQSGVLEIGYPLLDDVKVYTIDSSGLKNVLQLGENADFSDRPVRHRNFIVPLQLASMGKIQLIIKVQTGSPIYVPLKMWTWTSFVESESTTVTIQGIYLGVVFVMALYNLFVFFSLRIKTYLYYVFCIICFAGWLTALNGMSYQYLWPNSPWWAEKNLFFFYGMGVGFASLFANQFLELKQHTPRMHAVIRIIGAGGCLVALGSFVLPYSSITLIGNIMSVVGVPCLFAAGLIRWQQGNRAAGYYTLAWGSLLLGAMTLSLTVLGVLPINDFTVNAPQVGSAIEVILLSFALARKFKTLTDEKLQVQKDAADSLQQKVEERTRDLNQALQDLKISETKLATQARLTSIGHLVTGVVHEVGNPLNFLRGSLEMVREGIEEADPKEALASKQVQKSVDMAERATERISVVLENLRTFLAQGELELAPINPEQSIQSTLAFVQRDMDEQKIEAILDIHPCPAIEANDGVIRQVVLNIVINAMQAMEGGGTLNIQLEPADQEVRLSIRDSGPGIPADIRESIFDPFFTTKPPGESMGLGLSVTHEMVASYGGSIELGNPTTGAEFILSFPVQT